MGHGLLQETVQLLAGTVPQSDLDPHLRVHANMLLRIELLRDKVLCCDQVASMRLDGGVCQPPGYLLILPQLFPQMLSLNASTLISHDFH